MSQVLMDIDTERHLHPSVDHHQLDGCFDDQTGQNTFHTQRNDPITHATKMMEMAARPPSGSAVPRPGFRRTHSGSLSQRRPALRLMLSHDEQNTFSKAVQAARDNLVSDAAKLPKSTNMGLGERGPPPKAITSKDGTAAASHKQANASTSNGNGGGAGAASKKLSDAKPTQPWPIPQPVAEHERPHVLTEHQQAIKAHESQSHSWEESETFERRSASRSPESPQSVISNKAVFVRAIPCMYTSNVANSTSFYKDILGFSLVGKPDASHASLARSPSSSSGSASGAPARGTLKQAPADAVQIYIRIAPMGEDGQRVRPPPTTLWIQVNDVDEVFQELQSKWERFQPRSDEYFPMHSFGDAKILAKPQNKAWGNRELHVVDGDENKLIFFRQLR